MGTHLLVFMYLLYICKSLFLHSIIQLFLGKGDAFRFQEIWGGNEVGNGMGSRAHVGLKPVAHLVFSLDA